MAHDKSQIKNYSISSCSNRLAEKEKMNKVVLFAFLATLFALFSAGLSKEDAGDTSEIQSGKVTDEARIKEKAATSNKLVIRGLRERRSSQKEKRQKKNTKKINKKKKSRATKTSKNQKKKTMKKTKQHETEQKKKKNNNKRNKTEKSLHGKDKTRKNKGRTTEKMGKYSQSSPVSDTCTNNAVNFLKMKNTQAQNFEKQFKRHGRFADITEKKHGKGKPFTMDALMILNAGGGNLTELSCYDADKSSGAEGMKSVFEELIKCEDNIEKSCDYNAITFSNISKVGPLQFHKNTFSFQVEECGATVKQFLASVEDCEQFTTEDAQFCTF